MKQFGGQQSQRRPRWHLVGWGAISVVALFVISPIASATTTWSPPAITWIGPTVTSFNTPLTGVNSYNDQYSIGSGMYAANQSSSCVFG
jgi:hypothetical protein